jgi:hypothetical protein
VPQILTPLGDDVAGRDDDDGPVEFALKEFNNLVGDLAESRERAVGDANEESLAAGAVGLLVFNQISAVDLDL